MVPIKHQVESAIAGKGLNIVAWNPKYETGIELIDKQHKELVSLTNELYQACLSGRDTADAVFKDAMSRMVMYVRFHFGAEQELLEKINYPQYHEHKKMHDDLVRQILEAAKKYNDDRNMVPNIFVRTLKDWIFSHIAIVDKQYAIYIMEQKKKGLLEGV